MGWRAFIAVAGAILAVDRMTKLYVLDVLDLPSVGRIDVVPPFLVLVMAWNTGINFGLFGEADMRWVLTGIAIVISVLLGWWALRRGNVWVRTGAAVVIGGALGNAWDRIQYGAVADFLNMSCCGIQNPFAFNVADIAIFIGAVVIAIKA